jgi:hypothetical protein
MSQFCVFLSLPGRREQGGNEVLWCVSRVVGVYQYVAGQSLTLIPDARELCPFLGFCAPRGADREAAGAPWSLPPGRARRSVGALDGSNDTQAGNPRHLCPSLGEARQRLPGRLTGKFISLPSRVVPRGERRPRHESFVLRFAW